MATDEQFDHALEAMRTLDYEERKRLLKELKRERLREEASQKQELELLPNSHWSKKHLLDRIPNPTHAAYEQKILIPEWTFLGVANQPDFGEMLLTFYPGPWTIELKSLKVYKDSFRDAMASYERLANVVFDDLMAVFEPRRLRLMMSLRPRGGISSSLTIDSDWKIRGGTEQFNDWGGNVDTFGFQVHNVTRL
jgi:7-cyano-7-deazaguanine reductase